MIDFWTFITDFGDSSVTLPLAAFLLLYLLTLRRWRSALAWALTIGSCGLAMASLKILFQSCEPVLATNEFVSASGHSAMSAMVYGGFALLLTTRPAAWPQVATGGLAVILIMMIAVSRVIVGAHQPLEVVVGLLVGCTAVLVFRRLRQPDAAPLPILWPSLGAFVLIAFLHGTRWPIEEVLRDFARLIGGAVPACREPG